MKDIMKVLQDELYILIEYSMKQQGLGQSDLLNKAKINISDNIFLLIFPDYIDYVNSGRRPNAKMPPADAIINWCRQKGIPTDNNTVWRIRQGIAKQGIKARPVLDMIFDLAENEWMTDWSQRVFNEIIEELINWFK